jgi:hypothetical protein
MAGCFIKYLFVHVRNSDTVDVFLRKLYYIMIKINVICGENNGRKEREFF